MKITYAFLGLDSSERLKARADKKLGKLDKYFKEAPETTVRFKRQNNRCIVEITLKSDGVLLRAEESTDEMFLSIDRAVDKIESQIRKHRTKLENRLHTAELEIAPEYVDDEPTQDVVRVKKFTMKPMTVDDAIAQMDMLGHSFFLFPNEETGTMNVVYRRNDGGLGLLQPED